MAKKIIVRIQKKRGQAGVCSIETEGFRGDECLKATVALKEALGEEIEDSKEMKPEFFDMQYEEELL